VAAVFGALRGTGLKELLEANKRPSLILALDHVGNPRNLGTLMRSATAFGAHGVICPRDRQVGLSPAAIKTAQGAIEHVPLVRVTNLNSALKDLKEQGYWIVGADREGEISLPSFKFPARSVVVLGAESKGLSRLTGELCDFLIRIPINPAIDSLNVSVAGSILMYSYFGGVAAPDGDA
jgi:23S rRNA (guanosine2251-2'-O)-methyltransferase